MISGSPARTCRSSGRSVVNRPMLLLALLVSVFTSVFMATASRSMEARSGWVQLCSAEGIRWIKRDPSDTSGGALPPGADHGSGCPHVLPPPAFARHPLLRLSETWATPPLAPDGQRIAARASGPRSGLGCRGPPPLRP